MGFKQERGIGRVFVRTSDPVRYGVGEDSHRNVVLSLENARIGLPNNERLLDTSFFDTAVARVVPEEAADGSVKVVIQLKSPVGYHTSQDGTEVSLEFARP